MVAADKHKKKDGGNGNYPHMVNGVGVSFFFTYFEINIATMKQISYIIGILALLVSCSKSYQYIEIVEEKDIFSGQKELKEKDPVTITAVSDSDAFCQAYQKFCISQRVENDMIKKGIGTSTLAREFKLIDEQNNDITLTVSFAHKDSILADIYSHIMGLSLASSKSELGSETEHASADPEKVKSLEKYFKKEKDEFDTDSRVWYQPKSSPKYRNQNGIYLYFATKNNIPGNLRLCIQYHADDWLFFKKVSFSIDGKAYDYIPLKTETDCGNGGRIWEWSDEAITESNDKQLVKALANAKSAKMKFIGRQYHNIKTLSKQQIEDIKRTIELYHAMGGDF